MAILALTERLAQPGQVVLDRRHDEQTPRAIQVASGPHQSEVVGQGAVPTAAPPGNGPPRTTVRRGALLDSHPGLVDRPRRHGALATLVFRDECLQDNERQPRPRVLLELRVVQRELPGPLPDRMSDGLAQIARGEDRKSTRLNSSHMSIS